MQTVRSPGACVEVSGRFSELVTSRSGCFSDADGWRVTTTNHKLTAPPQKIAIVAAASR